MDAHADRLFPDLEMDADDELSLTCPACGADLVHDLLFLEYRVCSLCDRHFAMPARERVELLVDEGTYRDLHDVSVIEELDNDQVSALDRIADRRERPIIDEAIVVGTGKIGGTSQIGCSSQSRCSG